MFMKRHELEHDDQRFLFTFERHYGELELGLPESVFKRLLVSSVMPVVFVEANREEASILYSTTSTNAYYPQSEPATCPRNIGEPLPA
jgi:hypothetical protein